MPESERKLIQRIRRLARGGTRVVTGIGDDAAVLRLPPGHDVLVTTDFSIENVHFRREWHSPEEVGWRCLTRGLSDIAAMGGEPRAAFLSLAVPSDTPQKWVDRFLKGLLALAKECKTPLAGGDTAQSVSGIEADIVVVGTVPKGKAVLRSGAKPGEEIYVTGELGGSAAMVAFHAGKARSGSREASARITDAIRRGTDYSHLRPVARVAVGRWLREHGIPAAMIDVSDGLSTDLEHICMESHVGAVIEADATDITEHPALAGLRLCAVVSSLPIIWFSVPQQRAVVRPCLDRLGPNGRFLQLTNAFSSPLAMKALGVSGAEVARVWLNLPPAQIWSYWDAAASLGDTI
jgi:thiamine-monophosphate kinase